MKKISVLGGGIAGMSAVLFLRKLYGKNCKINLYSDSLGGEYGNGGLKYIYFDTNMKLFCDRILNYNEYKIAPVIGAIYDDKCYCDDRIKMFPEYLLRMKLANTSVRIYYNRLQTKHWGNTRGEKASKFDDTCMNDPWNYKSELKMIFQDGINGFINHMKELVNNSYNKFYIGKIEFDDFKYLMRNEDLIISTIPFKIIAEYFGIHIEVQQQYRKLYVYELEANMKNIWWDYLYVPDKVYPFHRISKTEDGKLQFEINDINFDINNIGCDILLFTQTFLTDEVQEQTIKQIAIIKGHINSVKVSEEIKDELSNNKVKLLGRFATLDSRVTLNKVIKQLSDWSMNQKI